REEWVKRAPEPVEVPAVIIVAVLEREQESSVQSDERGYTRGADELVKSFLRQQRRLDGARIVDPQQRAARRALGVQIVDAAGAARARKRTHLARVNASQTPPPIMKPPDTRDRSRVPHAENNFRARPASRP